MCFFSPLVFRYAGKSTGAAMFMVPLDTLCCRIQLFLLLVYLVLWAVSPVAVGYPSPI